MKVLVTGGTGFTGSHTVHALVASGHEVRLLVRDPTKVRGAFEPYGFVPEDIVVGDMTDAAAVDDALAGCDGVVHTAALVDLRRAMARVVEDANARGVELVIGGAARRGLPSIVYVSSLGVFFEPGGPALSPELPVTPGTTAYGRSKAQAEQYVRRLQENGAPIRISYPSAISGPNDPTMSMTNIGLRSMVRDIGLVTSSGLQVVDVRDLATLHRQLLELPAGPHRYAAAGEMLTWAGLFALTGQPDRPSHPAHTSSGRTVARRRFSRRSGKAVLRLRCSLDARPDGISDALARCRRRAHHPRIGHPLPSGERDLP